MAQRVVEFGAEVNLVGVLCHPSPDQPTAEDTFVILLNSGTLHRVGPCRLYVKLAQHLANIGIPSLRFDFSGIGDSHPRSDGLAFHDYSVAEVSSAIDYLSNGAHTPKIILLGICSGADTAWYSAINDPRVSAVVLVDGFAHRNLKFYWHHYKQRIFSAAVWKNFLRNPMDGFAFLSDKPSTDSAADIDGAVFDRDWPDQDKYSAGLEQLKSQKTSLYYVFTGGVYDYLNHPEQFSATYKSMQDYDRLSVDHYPEADHMISDIDTQRELIGKISTWVQAI
jgi:hypothetical protein